MAAPQSTSWEGQPLLESKLLQASGEIWEHLSKTFQFHTVWLDHADPTLLAPSQARSPAPSPPCVSD